jgi:nicotinamidase-related amidase
MAQPMARETPTALLVIDLQSGMFCAERPALLHAGDALLTRVHALLAGARAAGVPVVYVRHDGGPGHRLQHGTAGWQIHPMIAPVAGDAIVDKRTPDAFHGTSLSSVLGAIGARRLVVVGAQSEVCVDTTCRRAFSLGLEVTLVADGHTTWDNAVLSAEQIIRHTNQTLSRWCVRLAAADAVWFGAGDRSV